MRHHWLRIWDLFANSLRTIKAISIFFAAFPRITHVNESHQIFLTDNGSASTNRKIICNNHLQINLSLFPLAEICFHSLLLGLKKPFSPAEGLVAAWGQPAACSLAAANVRRSAAFCWELWFVCLWGCIGSSGFSSQGRVLLWAWRSEVREKASLLEQNKHAAAGKSEKLNSSGNRSHNIKNIVIIIIIY